MLLHFKELVTAFWLSVHFYYCCLPV